ncbi:MAG: SIS domain-containing protein [Bacilli bacterium]
MEDEKYVYTTAELIERYPILKECEKSIIDAYLILKDSFYKGGKLLVAGNGGSCADSEHIVGELMKGFKKRRQLDNKTKASLISIDPIRGKELGEKIQGGLPAIALDGHPGLSTAFTNDVENGGLLAFAQQVNGYGSEKDVFLGISTSGNSKNVMYAAVMAKAKGMKVIGLTGKKGGCLKDIADVTIMVPETETFMVQELHLPIYHCLCLLLENEFFSKGE